MLAFLCDRQSVEGDFFHKGDEQVKKLLILAGVDIHNKVVETAKQMGIYTIVTDYLADSPAKRLADESLMYDIFDVDGLIAWGKSHQIDGVLDFCCDPAQKPTQQIAEALGLPVFGTAEQMHILTNKNAFKQFCTGNDVDVIPSWKKMDFSCGFGRESADPQFPLLVKPADNRGSRGISICTDHGMLDAAIRRAESESVDQNVIIERYMGGHQDLTISYLVKDGEPTLVSVGDRYSGRKEDGLQNQLACTIQPSRYTQMYLEHVNPRVVQMIKKLGIQNGPVFMQGFVDGNTVRMYDPGIRYPGNEYERILYRATGVNLMQSLISYAVGDGIMDFGGNIHGCYDLNGSCAMQYMINVRAGKIAEIHGLQEIAAYDGVIDVRQKHGIGDVIADTGDIGHRIGEISILVDRDVEQMSAALRFIQSNLSVISDTGEDMIISPFLPEQAERYYGNGETDR